MYYCEVTSVAKNNVISAKIISKNKELTGIYPLAFGTLDKAEIGEKVLVINLDRDNKSIDLNKRDNLSFYLKSDVYVPFLRDNGIVFSDSGLIVNEENDELTLYNGEYLNEDVAVRLVNTVLPDTLVIDDEEDVILEGDFPGSYTSQETKLFVPTLEPDVDYNYRIIEFFFYEDMEVYGSSKEDALTHTEKRIIVNFHYDSDEQNNSYIVVASPLSQKSVNSVVTEFKIYNVDLKSYNSVKFVEIDGSNGFKLGLTARKDNKSGFFIMSPSSGFEIHEDTLAQDPEDDDRTVRYGDQYLEYRSFNYSQIYSGGKATGEAKGVHSEQLDHEDRRGYTFGIYNQDYFDVDSQLQFHGQMTRLRTPKHLLEIVDTSHLGNPGDLEGAREQEVLYSSLDGNYLKFMSNSSLGSALEVKTHLGHRTVWDDSHLTFEQHKTYDRDTRKLVTKVEGDEEMPVNFIDFDKTTEAEKITVESHSNSDDMYETLMNRFEFSETAEDSTAKIENLGDEDKSNKITMTTAEDGSIKIENTFEDGKTNTIEMTKELIKISNAEDKVVIEIDAENMKITTEADVTVEASGDVNIKGTNVKVEGDVELTSGSAKIAGTVSPTGSGALCGIPACLFTGAPHVGDKSEGT